MMYGLETVAVTEKQVEEMEVAEMKTLRFAMGVTRKYKIRNEDKGGQAEVVWTCHEKRPRICRKKDDGNGVTGKEEKRETKEKIFRRSERRYGEVGARRWTLKTGHFVETSYAMATPD